MKRRQRIDVEDLLHWVYGPQAADSVERRIYGGLRPSGFSSSGGLANLVALGTKVDGSQGLRVANVNELDPDAEAVHDAVLAFGQKDAALIIIHAKTRRRPELIEAGDLKVLPIRNRFNGKIQVERDWANKRPFYCPIRYEPNLDWLAFLRSEYLRWHDSLSALTVALSLRSYLVTGPEAPREPWNKP